MVLEVGDEVGGDAGSVEVGPPDRAGVQLARRRIDVVRPVDVVGIYSDADWGAGDRDEALVDAGAVEAGAADRRVG